MDTLALGRLEKTVRAETRASPTNKKENVTCDSMGR